MTIQATWLTDFLQLPPTMSAVDLSTQAPAVAVSPIQADYIAPEVRFSPLLVLLVRI